ncbi:MAG: PCRF domain-containing protein, partial [Chloroflexi bacterium]|nr:PCRF domain-containing protein [Chloroflexota bacterium]
MFEKLAEVEERFRSLEERLADPEIVKDQQDYQQVAKAHSDLSEIVGKWREYKQVKRQFADTESLLSEKLDDEMRDMAQLEFDELKERIASFEEDLRIMLLPKDPNDEKDVIVEIRAGTGGEEAGLFAADLLRMYTRFAERQGWQTELMSAVETGIGGFKDAVLAIKGRGAYSRLKFEAGIHRVQRVPATESSGRIHTSAATVSVLPEADEIDVQVNADDLNLS